MRFIRTMKIGTHSLSQFTSRQEPGRLDHRPLAMHPSRFNGIEPGALFGQQQRQNADPFARPFDLLIVLANPSTDQLAHMPGSVVPDQEPVALAFLFQPLTTPIQKLQADRADWPSSDKAQPHLIAHGTVWSSRLPEDSIA